MIRQLIFISVFAAAAAMAALAQNVTGTVTCGGAGVSGVAVSDGINVVTTDKQGRYALQTDKANGYVFISIPRGYTVDMADGFSPQFWQKLSDAKVETAEVHNFKLTYSPADDYVMIIGADSHLARRIGDRKTYKNGYIASLKYEKEKAAESQLPTYSMILGDLTWDNFWYANKYTLRNFMDDQRKMHYPVPLFPVIGNHDNDPAVPHSANTDFLAAKLWRDVVCPNYYSYTWARCTMWCSTTSCIKTTRSLPGKRRAKACGGSATTMRPSPSSKSTGSAKISPSWISRCLWWCARTSPPSGSTAISALSDRSRTTRNLPVASMALKMCIW